MYLYIYSISIYDCAPNLQLNNKECQKRCWYISNHLVKPIQSHHSLPVAYLMQWQVQWTPLLDIDLEDLEVCDIIIRIDLPLLCPRVLEQMNTAKTGTLVLLLGRSYRCIMGPFLACYLFGRPLFSPRSLNSNHTLSGLNLIEKIICLWL